MARKNGPPPDDLESMSRYGSGRADVEDYSNARTELDSADVIEPSRLSDNDLEQQSPFLRAQKRVPVRRGPLPKKAAGRLKVALVCLGVLGVAALVAAAANRYGLKSWRFRIDSSDQIQIAGNQNVSRSQILDVFGGDISKNVFAVPLEVRRRQVEQIPWVESASVMRQLPNRLAVVVNERTPVAFAQVGSRIALIDANGVVMEMPSGPQKYSFPVIMGFTDAEPLSTKSARMKIYMDMLRALDSSGAHYSQDISEVDLSDPEDAKITVTEGAVLVHLGNSNYLDRYKVFVAHIQEWKQQYGGVRSVDLRYENQVVVDPIAPVQISTNQRDASIAPAAAAAKPANRVVGQWEGTATSAGADSKRKAAASKRGKARPRKKR